MKKLEARGRLVNPFKLFTKAARRAMDDMDSYVQAVPGPVRSSVFVADATAIRRHLRQQVDAVITSPPYHSAVDYYRRHQLEMFWLGLTTTQEERLGLLDRYLGRPKVPKKHAFVEGILRGPLARNLHASMTAASQERADAFKHYCVGMDRVFSQLGSVLRPGAPALFVVGHSQWNGTTINTSDLFSELAAPDFTLSEVLSYPVKNRYMSYSRHNGASIDQEYVLVFRRIDGSSG